MRPNPTWLIRIQPKPTSNDLESSAIRDWQLLESRWPA